MDNIDVADSSFDDAMTKKDIDAEQELANILDEEIKIEFRKEINKKYQDSLIGKTWVSKT